ncbi:L-threonylcarbamoyladenylate synthase [Mangrovimicrobium sediminis]|uniref:L-threonylcarbamoyladenylate synthase n=1 Tax=Mangrovimicrobium sediminis TaxID=2562682 RepID=UPI001F0F81B8|nr:Sua5/YciO/YrdC/YwlC family protein [Haliea sp. SAOS-164]
MNQAPPLSPLRLATALQALAAGDVIACPTEAVWGLSCDPFSAAAVEQLLQLKQRPVEKGLILVAADEAQLAFLLEDLSSAQRATLSLSWPGPNTWLVPHHGRVPPWVHGDFDTVAVRVSAHPTVRALCRAWGGPLVSTSANPAGAQPPRHAFQVRRYFGDLLADILPGAVGASARPSQIRDLASGELVRA